MDRVPVHNVAASVAASARSWLQSIDRTKLETSVPTPTLIMWLEILAQGIGPDPNLQASARDAVMGHFARVNEALMERDQLEAKGLG